MGRKSKWGRSPDNETFSAKKLAAVTSAQVNHILTRLTSSNMQTYTLQKEKHAKTLN